MKTKTASSRLALLAIAITTALVTQPVFGVPDHQMVFTEHSSSSLTATYDGSSAGITVFPVAANDWIVNFTQQNLEFNNPLLLWLEPGNANQVNELTAFLFPFITILSDFSATGTSAQPDGFTYVAVGFDVTTGSAVPFDVTFHDLGDVAAVPDTGTTGSLLGLSVMGLAFLRRKLC
jgi:VPDSG-CTERM motif